MRKPFVYGVVVVLAAEVAYHIPSEPEYDGRTLTEWLSDAHEFESDGYVSADAQAAIRSFGARKVLPMLLDLAQARASSTGAWIAGKADRLGIQFAGGDSAEEQRSRAVFGFAALGTNGAPAIKKLTKLLDDPELARSAVECLGEIGLPAKAALCHGLTNQDPYARILSLEGLRRAADDDLYFASVKAFLNDGNVLDCRTAVVGIGSKTNAATLAVPLLIRVLPDADPTGSALAAASLAKFGPRARDAVPALTGLSKTGGEQQIGEALRALAAIDPVAAASAASNAWQMTLARMSDGNARQRADAIEFAAQRYSGPAPGLTEALKAALADPDPLVAHEADNAVRYLLGKKNRAQWEGLLPNGPSYQGRTFDEWLTARENRLNDVSGNAQHALRQMGTNAIPALLARLTYREPVFGYYIDNVNIAAVKGLIALGEDSKPALPTLAALLDDEDPLVALRAMVAGLGLGADATPILAKAATNQFLLVRQNAEDCLGPDHGASFPARSRYLIPAMISRAATFESTPGHLGFGFVPP